MSTPVSRIQSGMAYQPRPSGSPDENDSSATEAVRHERMARTRLANAPSLGFEVVVTSSPYRRSDTLYQTRIPDCAMLGSAVQSRLLCAADPFVAPTRRHRASRRCPRPGLAI